AAEPAAEAAAVPADSSSTDEPEPTTPAAEQPAENPSSGTSPAAPAKKEPPADDAVPGFQQRLLAMLAEAWSARDELQASEAAVEWSPIHFAPHVWRELNARLLAYEQRVRAGRPFEPQSSDAASASYAEDRLLHDLASLRDDLRDLSQQWRGTTRDSSKLHTDVARRLNRLREQAEASTSAAARNTADTPQEVAALRNAAYRTNEMMFEAYDYVRWHAAASFTSVETLPVYQDLCKYLQVLGSFRRRLDGLKDRDLTADDTELLKSMRREFDALAAMRDGLEGVFNTRTESALASLDQPVHQLLIENDLQTAHLPAGRRMQLMRELLSASAVTGTNPTPDDLPNAGTRIARWRAQRVRERLELERLLVQLADAEEADELDRQLAALRQCVQASSFGEASFWAECRGIGESLRQYYESLPQRSEYEILHLIDARDASRVVGNPPHFEFHLVFTTRPKLELAGLRQLRLSLESPKALTVQLRANRRDLLSRLPNVEYDRRLVTVTSGPQESPVASDSGWFTKTLTWQVSASMNRQQAHVAETDFSLTVQWNDDLALQTSMHKVSLVMPLPDEVNLVVQRVGSNAWESDA
ncbi:MAG: hypothetical protein JJ992_15990, partial [Planctomycetes bacterium]|nr:hypothetical protein [Planctomycetota bacterium]